MSWLDEPVATPALCWRLERRDGVGVGLTSHDRDLLVGGNLYRASPGMTPSAIRRSGGGEADTMEVAGVLDAAAIREDDLLGGRWDGTRAAVFAVDWSDTANRVALGQGELGALEMADGRFSAELRGNGAALDRAVSEETCAECRAELGDARCRVAMAGRVRTLRVVAADEVVLTLDAAEPVANGWGGGRLRWLDGANAGIEAAVAVSAGRSVTLFAPPPFPVAPGDRAEIVEGCDKRIATCAERFGNAVNFRGEPYLPGVDLLTRYPGA